MRDPFPTTAWSDLLSLQARGEEGAREAIGRLYEAYWAPLYSYLRRRGYDPDAAGDLLQSFYLHLVEKEVLRHVERAGGRLRAFLIVALRNFARDEHARERARKRSPEAPLLSLDLLGEERRFQARAAAGTDPETLFEEQWARTVAARAVRELVLRDRDAGRSGESEILRGYVLGGAEPAPYSEAAARLGISESAVKVRVHRYRKRLGSILRQEVARTVSDETAVDGELRLLLGRLGGGLEAVTIAG